MLAEGRPRVQCRAAPRGEESTLRRSFLRGLSRSDWARATLCGVLALVVYVLTLAPTVTAEDSGELAAAAYSLGIAHPPGYPLFVLLGKLFLTAFPFGEVAYRLNLLSAVMGALAVALLVLLCRRLSASRSAAIGAGLLAAFTPVFWSQATMAEVYTLAAVCLVIEAHLFLNYLSEPKPTALWLLGYVFGLGLVAHPILVFLGPGLLLGVLLRDRTILGRLGELATGGLFFLLGFAIYLYLPLRSLADPAMDWGNPETLQGFLSHLLRSQYAGMSRPPEHPVRDGVLYLGHLAAFEIGPVVTALAAFGMRSLLKFPGEGEWPGERRRARRAFVTSYLLWILATSVGLLFVLNVSFEKQALALNEVFFIPLLLLLAPAAALGIEDITAWALRRTGRCRQALTQRRFHWVPAAAIALAFVLVHYRGQDRSGYRIARDYAENVLKTLPPNAVYLPSGDHANFPVLYLQLVEGLRPDVMIADRYGYLDAGFLRKLGATEPEVRKLLSQPRKEADRWVIDRAGRPIFVNSKRSILEIPTDRFLPVGLLYRVDRERTALTKEDEDKLWASYDFQNLGDGYSWKRGLRDIPADLILSEILFHKAESLFQRKEDAVALNALEALRAVASGLKEILQNAGSLLAERKHVKEAASFYEDALRVDPGYRECRQNYARALLHAEVELEKAVAMAEKSLDELPPDAAFLKDLGRAYRKLGRCADAMRTLHFARELGPEDPEPSRLIGEIWEKERASPDLAKGFYGESLRLKPTQAELIEKVKGKEARRRFEENAQAILDELIDPHLPAAARAPGSVSRRETRFSKDLVAPVEKRRVTE